MPISNNFVVTARQLEALDEVVYSPADEALLGRQLFSVKKVDPLAKNYTYQVANGYGQATRWTNRMTDIPSVDVGLTEYTQPITDFTLALEFSDLEVSQANKNGVNLPTEQATVLGRAMAEYEDKLIFNGDDEAGILGLTSSGYGAQELKAVNASGSATAMSKMTPDEIYAYLKEAKSKITHLKGYSQVRPILVLPQDEYDVLDSPWNAYQDVTILQKIQNEGWFGQIRAVPELAKDANQTQADVGFVIANTAEVVQIIDAMPVTRGQEEHSNMRTKIPYLQRSGGLAIRYPHGIVKLSGI